VSPNTSVTKKMVDSNPPKAKVTRSNRVGCATFHLFYAPDRRTASGAAWRTNYRKAITRSSPTRKLGNRSRQSLKALDGVQGCHASRDCLSLVYERRATGSYATLISRSKPACTVAQSFWPSFRRRFS
jgi:hypothetical protein